MSRAELEAEAKRLGIMGAESLPIKVLRIAVANYRRVEGSK